MDKGEEIGGKANGKDEDREECALEAPEVKDTEDKGWLKL